ncbi:hypothetical protein [Salinicoccus sp. CNSTN-B1]
MTEYRWDNTSILISKTDGAAKKVEDMYKKVNESKKIGEEEGCKSFYNSKYIHFMEGEFCAQTSSIKHVLDKLEKKS